jgi:putative Ca2+/H+ antiporter (TMEM165/GDT1 family)
MRQLFLSTFVLVFLAELGDKTQLATLALASRSEQEGGRIVVFAAAALALVCASALAVLAGSVLARTVPHHIVRWCAGLLFVGAGIWILIRG